MCSSLKYFSFSIFFYRASLIPFIEHNDANRALMSSNMQRQAVPLCRLRNALLGPAGNGDILSIPLVIYQRSNKILVCIKTPADGAATVGGELALGKNVLVAYMPWEGYNFEDADLLAAFETGDILVGKLTPQVMKESSYAPEDRLLRAILGIQRGRAELLVFSCCQRVEQWFFRVVKDLNNENRWRVPDRIDQVM
ncbi:hypothetical protein H5410_056285 [Solanum commersonii]|uniref:DNA-directed RNA polymerase n=1 Tax=Solanum commersonii TaxID=4109 RepID=A0A9J5WLQ5_SOLCO|nr:hypothetical protein H5410_056285 [Solanum commersonii]